MIAYGDYAIVAAVAAVGTFSLTFPIRRLAGRIGAVAPPGEDRVHARPTPTIGGAAMFIGFAAAMLVASRLPGLQGIFTGSSEPLGLVLGAFVIFGVGLVDDVRNISAPAKVAGQVLAAMVLVFLGVTMYWFKIPFVSGIIQLAPSVLPLVTAVWVVGMANAVNLIDGLDGLAAGIIAIASGALCVYGIQLIRLGDLTVANGGLGTLVAAIACGACVGFLPHNFHPARVFMGDSGALFLGLLMAAATMIIGGRTSTVSGGAGSDVSGHTFFSFAPLFIPFFILGVPILDTVFAIVRRTVRRTSFAERDLGHLHHRLVRLGHGHRRAVLILWAWTAVLSAFALVPIFDSRANVLVPFVVAFLGVGLYTVFRPGASSRSPRSARPTAAIVGPARTDLDTNRAVGALQAGPVSVVMSASAGVAVAGEPDLASPSRRRRPRRRRHLRRRRQTGATNEEPGARNAAPPSAPARFAGGDDEVGG
ncbi:MAG: wecA [Acidimicrobiaceae bacterium]|jgi:UDP-GlcNAc:undecaprenyl-phosphate GlcNAc-1-phosphate transferase|nr:wecA [Acidimicrobiaceae bacterium]